MWLYLKKLYQSNLRDLAAFAYYHPKLAKLILYLNNLFSIASALFAVLVVLYFLNIISIPRELIKLGLLVYIVTGLAFMLFQHEFMMHVLKFFDKSSVEEDSFLVLQYKAFQLDYDYIDRLSSELEDICGKIIIRASYEYSGEFNDDETVILTPDSHNSPNRRIMRIIFEAERNNSDCYFVMYFKRVPLNVYSCIFMEGKGFKKTDSEKIITIVENLEYRLKPDYNFLINIRLGATYFIFFLAAQFIVYYFTDYYHASDYDDFISWLSFTNIILILGIDAVLLGVLLYLLRLKSSLFPSGTFYIDQEKIEIEKRKHKQQNFLKFIERFLWVSVN